MDKRKLARDRLKETINKKLLETPGGLSFVDPREKDNYSEKGRGNIPDILGQRHFHRRILFWYAVSFSIICLLGLILMLWLQVEYKIDTGQELFSKLELGTVGIGVFVQFLGLLKIITDSLWNDEPYLKHGALKHDQKDIPSLSL